MADIMHCQALSYVSHSPPVTTVPDVAFHHMLRNETTGEFKVSCVASALQIAPKGIVQLMTVFKQVSPISFSQTNR